MDILERAKFLADTIETDEDREFDRAAAIIRDGWDRSKGVLHFEDEHADIVVAAVITGVNCLDDELQHSDGDRELNAINKALIAAANRMVATIRRQ
jgi:hypothetical protein